MNSSKRNSTVHDLTSLRLHPDGTRVGTVATSARHAQHIIQDRRGNWIAGDAGGLGRVKKKWPTRVNEGQTPEDELTALPDTQHDSPKDDKGKGKAKETYLEEAAIDDDNNVKDSRALRRKLFAEDLSFLRTPPRSGMPAETDTVANKSPADSWSSSAVLPSSVSIQVRSSFATRNNHSRY